MLEEIQKIAKETKNLQVTHNCIYLSPFANEPDGKIHCMKAFNKSNRIIKVDPDDCNYCFSHGLVISLPPKPLTEMQRLERQDECWKKKREEYNRATTRTGLITYDELSKKAKEWEDGKKKTFGEY
jgi:hypothetical protein